MTTSSFQSRNRETYDSNDLAFIVRSYIDLFQSRNRETYDSNLEEIIENGVRAYREFQSRNREAYDFNFQ